VPAKKVSRRSLSQHDFGRLSVEVEISKLLFNRLPLEMRAPVCQSIDI